MIVSHHRQLHHTFLHPPPSSSLSLSPFTSLLSSQLPLSPTHLSILSLLLLPYHLRLQLPTSYGSGIGFYPTRFRGPTHSLSSTVPFIKIPLLTTTSIPLPPPAAYSSTLTSLRPISDSDFISGHKLKAQNPSSFHQVSDVILATTPLRVAAMAGPILEELSDSTGIDCGLRCGTCTRKLMLSASSGTCSHDIRRLSTVVDVPFSWCDPEFGLRSMIRCLCEV